MGSLCLCPQEAYELVVEYFGENPKTTPPTMFFPTFMRFIKAYKVKGPSSNSLGGGAIPPCIPSALVGPWPYAKDRSEPCPCVLDSCDSSPALPPHTLILEKYGCGLGRLNQVP